MRSLQIGFAKLRLVEKRVSNGGAVERPFSQSQIARPFRVPFSPNRTSRVLRKITAKTTTRAPTRCNSRPWYPRRIRRSRLDVITASDCSFTPLIFGLERKSGGGKLIGSNVFAQTPSSFPFGRFGLRHRGRPHRSFRKSDSGRTFHLETQVRLNSGGKKSETIAPFFLYHRRAAPVACGQTHGRAIRTRRTQASVTQEKTEAFGKTVTSDCSTKKKENFNHDPRLIAIRLAKPTDRSFVVFESDAAGGTTRTTLTDSCFGFSSYSKRDRFGANQAKKKKYRGTFFGKNFFLGGASFHF